MNTSLSTTMPDTLLADLQQFMLTPTDDDEAFNAIALRVFKHQFQYNQAYQRYCRHIGKTPRLVQHWSTIPAVPINAFKDVTLSCIAPDDCQQVFMTSGTTRVDVKGRNYHPDLQIYDLSMRLYFAKRVMGSDSRLPMGVLFPTPEMLPNSSLAHYLALAIEHFGTEKSRNFMTANGLDIEAIGHDLRQAEQQNTPYVLLGASYSLVHLMDALRENNLRFQLPTGSRLFDTGGFKGQSREIAPAQFYADLTHFFGVSAEQCINMYGMTELSSQIYDSGNAIQPSVKSGPHWTRCRIVDPLTGQEMPEGQPGIITHYDLANYNSACALLTEDVGVRVPTGFLLLGRAEGADAKGCSLAMEAFLQAAQ